MLIGIVYLCDYHSIKEENNLTQRHNFRYNYRANV